MKRYNRVTARAAMRVAGAALAIGSTAALAGLPVGTAGADGELPPCFDTHDGPCVNPYPSSGSEGGGGGAGGGGGSSGPWVADRYTNAYYMWNGRQVYRTKDGHAPRAGDGPALARNLGFGSCVEERTFPDELHCR